MNNETYYFIHPAEGSIQNPLARRVVLKAKEHYTSVVAMGSELPRIYDKITYWANREGIESPRAQQIPQVRMTQEGDTIVIHVNTWKMKCYVINDFLFNEKGEHVNV